MKIYKVVLILFCLSITSFLFPAKIVAKSPESFGLITQKTLPGSPSYSFKRIKEKTIEFFKISKGAKFKYQKSLTEKRVAELIGLVENNNTSQIANAAQRLAYQAGIWAENGVPGKSNEIISDFSKYEPILSEMRDHFPANSPSWLLIQQDIDTLNILSRKIK